ncbi:hypothetical protein ADUPG1_010611 [Aduncisulcus paluster]|uniref:Protein kinase domain-containing protein n=1 Tax=Aduncisulcus paluster TaxID=2918883 RepID=A0ABQ5JWL7_9EUKA|nr:hypothetical protein ADUPG1_010611 [Aduncisulcus paluster]
MFSRKSLCVFVFIFFIIPFIHTKSESISVIEDHDAGMNEINDLNDVVVYLKPLSGSETTGLLMTCIILATPIFFASFCCCLSKDPEEEWYNSFVDDVRTGSLLPRFSRSFKYWGCGSMIMIFLLFWYQAAGLYIAGFMFLFMDMSLFQKIVCGILCTFVPLITNILAIRGRSMALFFYGESGTPRINNPYELFGNLTHIDFSNWSPCIPGLYTSFFFFLFGVLGIFINTPFMYPGIWSVLISFILFIIHGCKTKHSLTYNRINCCSCCCPADRPTLFVSNITGDLEMSPLSKNETFSDMKEREAKEQIASKQRRKIVETETSNIEDELMEQLIKLLLEEEEFRKLEEEKKYILTSRDGMKSMCKIGQGAFGDVLLIEHTHDVMRKKKLVSTKDYLIFKKIISKPGRNVKKIADQEFGLQCKLYYDIAIQQIPQPFYKLDLLNEKGKGTYGFIMEYCRGGSALHFFNNWCVSAASPLTQEKPPLTQTISEDSSESTSTSTSYSRRSSEEPESSIMYDPMKVASLCFAMVKCVAAVLSTKGMLHRDIKPENFLVRVNPKHEPTRPDCEVILGDLGLSLLHEHQAKLTRQNRLTISDRMSKKGVVKGSSKFKSTSMTMSVSIMEDCALVGTPCFIAPEILAPEISVAHSKPIYSRKSDSFALAISIFALFNNGSPIPEISTPPGASMATILWNIISKNEKTPFIDDCPLFCELKKVSGPVHKCLRDIYISLTTSDMVDRKDACWAFDLIQGLKKDLKKKKQFIPDLGYGWAPPTFEDMRKDAIEKKRRGSIESADAIVDKAFDTPEKATFCSIIDE